LRVNEALLNEAWRSSFQLLSKLYDECRQTIERANAVPRHGLLVFQCLEIEAEELLSSDHWFEVGKELATTVTEGSYVRCEKLFQAGDISRE
jgi:hypothetical protein